MALTAGVTVNRYRIVFLAFLGCSSSHTNTSANPSTSSAAKPTQCSGSGLCVLSYAQIGATSLVLDANNAYWTATTVTSGGVMTVPLTGGTTTTIASNQKSAGAIAIDGSSIYWVAGDSVMKVPISGGTPAIVATNEAGPSGIALDANNLYWTNFGDSQGSGRAVRKMPLVGGAITTVAADTYGPFAIAVDAENIYWSDNAAVDNLSSVMRAGVSGGAAQILAPGGGEAYGIAKMVDAPPRVF